MNEQIFGARVEQLLDWLDLARVDLERNGSDINLGYYSGVQHAANIILGNEVNVVYDKETKKHRIKEVAA